MAMTSSVLLHLKQKDASKTPSKSFLENWRAYIQAHRKGVGSSNAARICEVGPDVATGSPGLKPSTPLTLEGAQLDIANLSRGAVGHQAHAVGAVNACACMCVRAHVCVCVCVQDEENRELLVQGDALSAIASVLLGIHNALASLLLPFK
eukprot:scaffold133637_cov21-Tisochrysis_lutea.AAC.1